MSAVILFDGVCNLCNSSVNFIIDHDRRGYFKLAAIQAHNRQRHIEGRYHDEFQSLLGPSIDRLLDLTAARLDF